MVSLSAFGAAFAPGSLASRRDLARLQFQLLAANVIPADLVHSSSTDLGFAGFGLVAAGAAPFVLGRHLASLELGSAPRPVARDSRETHLTLELFLGPIAAALSILVPQVGGADADELPALALAALVSAFTATRSLERAVVGLRWPLASVFAWGRASLLASARLSLDSLLVQLGFGGELIGVATADGTRSGQQRGGAARDAPDANQPAAAVLRARVVFSELQLLSVAWASFPLDTPLSARDLSGGEWFAPRALGAREACEANGKLDGRHGRHGRPEVPQARAVPENHGSTPFPHLVADGPVRLIQRSKTLLTVDFGHLHWLFRSLFPSPSAAPSAGLAGMSNLSFSWGSALAGAVPIQLFHADDHGK